MARDCSRASHQCGIEPENPEMGIHPWQRPFRLVTQLFWLTNCHAGLGMVDTVVDPGLLLVGITNVGSSHGPVRDHDSCAILWLAVCRRRLGLF